ncbi:MAG: TolB family protein [Thermoanaerobaculia bacterium]
MVTISDATHPRKTLRKLGVALALLLTWPVAELSSAAPRRRIARQAEAARVTVITPDGGHVDWLPGGAIAFDRAGSDGYFDLWIMNPDGSGQRNLTEGRVELPGKNIGQPAWHPSGRFIAFQAEKGGIPKAFENATEPGGGIFNDLWVMNSEGTRFWKLVDLPLDLSADAAGILHPHFSHDGKKLLWAQRIGRGRGDSFGSWVIRLADFSSENGTPSLENIRTLTPGQVNPPPPLTGAFYETHGFSPDDSHILYTSTVEGGLMLYELELSSGRIKRLSDYDPRVWEEHAHYSPDGSRIVYMSSKGLLFTSQPFDLQAEFWIMRRDGTGKSRLTWFHQPGHPQYRAGFAVAADSAWRADGKAFVGLIIRQRPETDRRGEGEIVLVELQ